jgi:hypothetical protein
MAEQRSIHDVIQGYRETFASKRPGTDKDYLTWREATDTFNSLMIGGLISLVRELCGHDQAVAEAHIESVAALMAGTVH